MFGKSIAAAAAMVAFGARGEKFGADVRA